MKERTKTRRKGTKQGNIPAEALNWYPHRQSFGVGHITYGNWAERERKRDEREKASEKRKLEGAKKVNELAGGYHKSPSLSLGLGLTLWS